MNIQALITQMITAAEAAARGHSNDLKTYIEARAKLIAEGSVAIVADRAKGLITDDDMRFAFGEIRASEKTALLASKATAKAAAQDAINAALSVASAAINSAVGIAVI